MRGQTCDCVIIAVLFLALHPEIGVESFDGNAEKRERAFSSAETRWKRQIPFPEKEEPKFMGFVEQKFAHFECIFANVSLLSQEML